MKTYWRRDVFLTSWFLMSWRTAWRIFNDMMNLLTSWRIIHVITYFLTSWWIFVTSWSLFSSGCNFDVIMNFLTSQRTSWRNFDVMTYFWCHAELIYVMTYFQSMAVSLLQLVCQCVWSCAHVCLCVGCKWISWLMNTLVILLAIKISSIKNGLVFLIGKCHMHVQW